MEHIFEFRNGFSMKRILFLVGMRHKLRKPIFLLNTLVGVSLFCNYFSRYFRLVILLLECDKMLTKLLCDDETLTFIYIIIIILLQAHFDITDQWSHSFCFILYLSSSLSHLTCPTTSLVIFLFASVTLFILQFIHFVMLL